jgi:hypothetical protein
VWRSSRLEDARRNDDLSEHRVGPAGAGGRLSNYTIVTFLLRACGTGFCYDLDCAGKPRNLLGDGHVPRLGSSDLRILVNGAP